MDWFLIKSVNAKYPLSCRKCVEKWTFCVLCTTGPPKCVAPPLKVVPPYSLGTRPPTNPKTLWSPVTPSSRKNWFSEGIFFWQITQTALESPKIDICQNWPRRVLEDVISCLESKFDKKIPMGSVPNCQKEIPARHAIRWFKCKLKPPKNITCLLGHEEQNVIMLIGIWKFFLCYLASWSILLCLLVVWNKEVCIIDGTQGHIFIHLCVF